MNSLEQRIAELESRLAPADIVDSRLTEKQKLHMRHMMKNLGIDEREAKMRVLCMGNPPEHFEQLAPGGEYPKMLYHKNGKFCTVLDADEQEEMAKQGFGDKPLPVHLKKLQVPAAARDEQINRLKKELDNELKAKAEELVPKD